ncbi:TPA: polysaccharide deacetylase family protein [Clostridium botulinum]|uniref:polysaccharide deacetylase family protein n=1 Tax=Clostridium botulinum TaxID=1491 RepID=UPI00035BA3AE|nr:polysaccharide deacetylase family protein [Clostridium botulinum]APH24655.1 polysaccharide deacetylase family protein [Clostridium botulinum]APQ68549.1 polysaccharide deacetylase family protein [Clostridium botulinum]EPS55466.1 polysaccharide deacetylase family protein [Clostridium botulinum Af84]MBN3349217.1 polysaccharide deacetylase [Clostridium botulinum]MBN3356785.1 polysaccharide deacetylase [Clostridium botulinum]
MNTKFKKSIYLLLFLALIFSGVIAFNYKVKADKKEDISDNKEVYLTFDDGPSDKTTENILDVLKENDVKATFFIIGKYIEGREDILKRIVKEGHSLGLHTYSHNYKTIYQNNKAFIDEMLKCQNEIYKATGVKTNIIRFPGGSVKRLDEKFKKELEEEGFKIYDWNMALTDGINPKAPVGKFYKEGTKRKKPLSKVILLMHCDCLNKNTCRALPDIIEFYKEKGYEFKIIDKNTPEFVFPYKR